MTLMTLMTLMSVVSVVFVMPCVCAAPVRVLSGAPWCRQYCRST
ncbi:hypothetical protein ACVV2G_28450 [Streptomyces ziwulingensis]